MVLVRHQAGNRQDDRSTSAPGSFRRGSGAKAIAIVAERHPLGLDPEAGPNVPDRMLRWGPDHGGPARRETNPAVAPGALGVAAQRPRDPTDAPPELEGEIGLSHDRAARGEDPRGRAATGQFARREYSKAATAHWPSAATAAPAGASPSSAMASPARRSAGTGEGTVAIGREPAKVVHATPACSCGIRTAGFR
jgi:hypothetical protein